MGIKRVSRIPWVQLTKSILGLSALIGLWVVVHEGAHFVFAPWPHVKSYYYTVFPPGWDWFYTKNISHWFSFPSALAGGLFGALYWFLVQGSFQPNGFFKGKAYTIFYYFTWILVGREMSFAFAEAFRYPLTPLWSIAAIIYQSIFLDWFIGGVVALLVYIHQAQSEERTAKKGEIVEGTIHPINSGQGPLEKPAPDRTVL